MRDVIKKIRRLIKPLEYTLAASMLLLTVSCGSVTQVNSDNSADVINDINTESTATEKTDDVTEPARTQDAVNKALYPARLDYLGNLWGYVDDSGTFVIKPKFSYAYRFDDDGLAKVEVDGKIGVIGQDGEYIIRPEYLSIDEFNEGRAAAQRDDGYVLIDATGKVLSKTYLYLFYYSDGRALFSINNGDNYFYGLLDKDGNEVLKPEYKHISRYEKGVVVAGIDDDKYTLMDNNGNKLSDINCQFVLDVSDGLIAYMSKGDGSQESKCGYMDMTGKVVIEPQFRSGEGFVNGTAIVNMSNYSDSVINKIGLIDKKGNFLIEPKYNEIIQLGEGMLAVGVPLDPENEFIGSKYALAANNGKLLTDFLFLSIGQFKNGVSSVYDTTQTFFIDKEGKRIDSLPQIDGKGTMEQLEELIFANIDNREYYMNKLGDIVYKPSGKIELANGITVEEKKLKLNSNYLVYMPHMTGADDAKVQENINSRLLELWGDSTIKQDTVMDHSYEGGFNMGFHRNNLVELEETGYDYPFGAAHGMPISIYSHIDVKTGRFYELKDLFKKGSNYADVLSKLVNKQIKGGKNEDVLLFDDNGVEVRKDHTFYISGDSLMVYFTPYEIAPYAAGFPTFTIPFSELDDIINKDGDFWKSFN